MRYFVSYSRQELYFAEALVNALQAAAFDVWFDLQRLLPGSRWQDEIEKGLEASEAVILLVSNSSLDSLWVAQEWRHALEQGKPLHLVLFDAVDFAQPRGEAGLKVDHLPAQAATITDLRAQFGVGVSRLVERLNGQQSSRDDLPMPNRSGIELNVPRPVAVVNLTMLLLTALSMVMTLVLFSESVLTLLLGIIITLYLAAETLRFARREAYAGTRLTLLAAPILLLPLSTWFGPVLTPILLALLLAGLFFAFRSPDVHRRSPPGQGMQHLRSQNGAFGGRRGDRLIYIMMPLAAMAYLDVLFFVPALLIQALTALLQRHFSIRVKGSAPATYELLHAPQDESIARDIELAMQAGGLQRTGATLMTRTEMPDYTLVVVTDELQRLELRPDARAIIPILAAPLQSTRVVSVLMPYQWVDYRRHDPLLLQQMVQDIVDARQNPGQRSLNSFSTRLVPRDFAQLILPRRIAAVVLYQLFTIQFALGLGLSQILTEAGASALRIFVALATLIISYVFIIYLQNRVIRREITRRRLSNLSFLLVFLGQVVGFMAAFFELSAGRSLNVQALGPVAVQQLAVMLVGYLLLRFGNWILLRYWLPRDNARAGSFPDSERDAPLWARNLRLAGFTTLFTFSLLGAPAPAQLPAFSAQETQFVGERVGDLALAAPAHWRRAWGAEDAATVVCDMPIAGVLHKAGNGSAATSINAYFFLRARAGNTPIMYQMGKAIERIFFRIISSLSSSDEFNWYAPGYGSSLYAAGYTEDDSCIGGQLRRYVLIQVWELMELSVPGWPESADDLARSIARGVKVYLPRRDDLSSPQVSDPSSQYVPAVVRSVSDLFSQPRPVFEISPGPSSDHEYVMPVSSPGGEYFVTISGDAQTLSDQMPLVIEILSSIQ